MSDLAPFRRRLDALDDEIARLLGERFEVCREIALFKHEHAIPMMQPDRVEQVRARYLQRGAQAQLPTDFTARLFELLIGATCALEDALIAAAGAAKDGNAGVAGGPGVAAAQAGAAQTGVAGATPGGAAS